MATRSTLSTGRLPMRGLVAVCVGAACGDNVTPPPDAKEPEPFRPAFHSPMPLALKHRGIVLPQVQLVTLAYADDPDGAELAGFGDAAVRSAWYAAVGAEFGVLPVSEPAPQHLMLGPAPDAVTRADLAAQIVTTAREHRAELTSQILYLIRIPASVTRGPDLAGVRGYHATVALDGLVIAYAVVLGASDDTAAARTISAGHQLIDAVTNPYPPPDDGYYVDAPTLDPWSLIAGELADMCEGEAAVVERGLAYPRVYSNLRAVQGGAPCNPPGPDTVWTNVTARPSRIQVVPPGTTFAFQLTGWSTEETTAWPLSLRVAERSALTETELRPELTSETINNNVNVTLTLRVPSGTTSGTAGGVYVLSGEHRHPWVVGVVAR